jgi:hypothetical protein
MLLESILDRTVAGGNLNFEAYAKLELQKFQTPT